MSTKYTLKDLVDYSLVNNGDQLSFTFKNHVFSASLFKGGLLGHCRWNDTPVFEDRSGFTEVPVGEEVDEVFKEVPVEKTVVEERIVEVVKEVSVGEVVVEVIQEVPVE